MVLSVSTVLFLLIVVLLLVKQGGLKTGQALMCILLGFYLASSSLAPTIRGLTTNVTHLVGQLHL
ncbi:hypothetical protein [Streptantibioticus ferralitis]|uniref:Uncharacterized protein n=1 Tax=Streptantibioticus ferralitis TaxID=236510 RepID=A0ABT5YS46_9ACTN|nr:hypothetical protein [Streptantibioticus ferralitis]MDF2254408.1 hypothetical protein [Streptantibioticus ferralitis]